MTRSPAQKPGVRVHKLDVSRSRAWVGFLGDSTTGRELAAHIDTCLAQGCPAPTIATQEPERTPHVPEVFRLPLVGGAQANLSLPLAYATARGGGRIVERLKALAQPRNFVAGLAGIVLLAFAVHLVELLCSAGIPAVLTQVLALHVGVFMLGDLVVLVTAVKTLKVIGLTTRYARWSNAIGGVSLLAIGALLIARPEWHLRLSLAHARVRAGCTQVIARSFDADQDWRMPRRENPCKTWI